MKMLLVLIACLGVLWCASCSEDEGCDAGEMRCSGTVAQMCSADNEWENYQDCSLTGYTSACSTSPAQCSGFSGIACCY